jgi:hypothetical protein
MTDMRGGSKRFESTPHIFLQSSGFGLTYSEIIFRPWNMA